MNETMLLATALVAVVLFLLYREWFHSTHVKWLLVEWQNERRELMDRIMARDFAQYKQATVIERMAPKIMEGVEPPDLGLEDAGS